MVPRPRPASPTWGHPFSHHQGGVATHYVIPHPPHPATTIPILPPAHTPIIMPPSPSHDAWPSAPSSPSEKSSSPSRTSMHWGHIAVYYLVEQMHRWERFVFRFDKQFSSMAALKSITGARISFVFNNGVRSHVSNMDDRRRSNLD